jgi:hypothetical protein
MWRQESKTYRLAADIGVEDASDELHGRWAKRIFSWHLDIDDKLASGVWGVRGACECTSEVVDIVIANKFDFNESLRIFFGLLQLLVDSLGASCSHSDGFSEGSRRTR